MFGEAKFALAFVAAILNFVRSAYNFYTMRRWKTKWCASVFPEK